MSKILITGAAGFIGFSLSKHLATCMDELVCIDNINNYYDINLKYARLAELGINKHKIRDNIPVCSEIYLRLRFIKMDLQQKEAVDKLFEIEHFDIVCHLAAQAGVRYSIDYPFEYINSNIIGFMNILEACRHYPVKHLVYASSSSVYGNENKVPYSETANVDCPVSLYAATKKADELLAYSYSQLYKMPATGVRFFTVYGPWGRPDMAPYLFMEAIASGKPIQVFNHGLLMRDFTYIDDAVNCLTQIINASPNGQVPHEIYNIGHSSPVLLMDFIAIIENNVGKKAVKEYMDMQPGDVFRTCADMTRFEHKFGTRLFLSIQEGVVKMYEWYKIYKQNQNMDEWIW